jgi:DNA-binding transcriptional LysR family regulator
VESGTREVFSDYLVTQGYQESDLENALEMGSTESIKGAVEAGMGITIISRSIIGKELKLNTLCELQLDPPLSRPFSFVRQRQKFRVTVMEKLLEFAQAYFRANA